MSLASLHSLDYTVLLCRDLPAMKAFYRDVMGFALVLRAVRPPGATTDRCP
jgi:catechol 2,3-dioxygenase-like lactoylglutathione lyase family enzyme